MPPLHKSMAMRCGQCRHIYKDYANIYTCPACNAGPPHTHTIYVYVDMCGNVIAPETMPKLRELGFKGELTRDEAVTELFGVGPDALGEALRAATRSEGGGEASPSP